MVLSAEIQNWRNGFKGGYAGHSIPVMSDADHRAYVSGHVEGVLMRLRHEAEYEARLFTGPQDSPTESTHFETLTGDS